MYIKGALFTVPLIFVGNGYLHSFLLKKKSIDTFSISAVVFNPGKSKYRIFCVKSKLA